MKRIITLFCLSLFSLTWYAMRADAGVTTSATITTRTYGPSLLLFPGESLSYSLTGTATGQILIEKSSNDREYASTGLTFTGSGVVSQTGTISTDKLAYFRFFVSTITAGSFITSLSDNDDYVGEMLNHKKQRIIEYLDDSVSVPGTVNAGVVSAPAFVLVVKTKAQIRAIIPSASREIYACSDCTTPVCVSTGTLVGQFSAISSTTTACN